MTFFSDLRHLQDNCAASENRSDRQTFEIDPLNQEVFAERAVLDLRPERIESLHLIIG